MRTSRKFSFAEDLLIALVLINVVCGALVIAAVSVTQTTQLNSDQSARLSLALSRIVESAEIGIAAFDAEDYSSLVSVVNPIIKSNPAIDVFVTLLIDGSLGSMNWSRLHGEGTATQEIPLEFFYSIAQSHNLTSRYGSYRIFGRLIHSPNGAPVGFLFAAMDERVSAAAMAPRLRQLGLEFLIAFLIQIMVMAIVLDRKLSRPLIRISDRFERLTVLDQAIGDELSGLKELPRIERATELLSASLKAKTNFLANMSHEIRTPMNGILGMLELLSDSKLDLEQRAQLSTVRNSSESLLTILNDILDLSKIEAGKIELENISFDLGSLTEDVCSLFTPAAVKKGVDVLCYIDPEMESFCIGDPVRIRQVFSNIIGNAVKFTSTGEVVVRVTLEKDKFVPWSVCFSVIDTGPGMSEQVVSELFQPFYQADTSATRQFGGTGLGLSISQQLVTMMGGLICVESEEGQGSEFRVKLPLQFGSNVIQYDVVPKHIADTRVLVVDDNQTNCEILSHYLDSWGLRHQCEHSPEMALQEYSRSLDTGQPYNLFLLDYLMPDMDGLTLADKISQLDTQRSPRFILVSSAHVSQSELDASPFHARIPKPVRKKLLLGTIVRILDETDSKKATEQPSVKELPTQFCGRVLLVEDNATNQLVAKAMLARLGISAEIADNGAQALEKMRASEYDLVFMDCLMPVMDGYKATQAWREQEQEPRLSIVALTANAQQEDRKKCIDAGMDDYLAKPMSIDGLRKILQKWL